MESFVKFYPFVEAIAEKVHNLGSDTLKVFLTDTLPSQSNSVLADITEIAYTNVGDRALTTSSSSQTSGTYKLIIANKTISATGTVPQWRYYGVYNDTATNKNLIGYWDFGSEVNMTTGQNLVITFDGTEGLIKIT